MRSSNSDARSRVTMFVLVMLPLGACATAMDSNLPGGSPLSASGAGSEPSAGGSGSANAGSPAGGAGAGKAGGGNGTSGAAPSAGAPSNTGGGGKGGAGSAGKGSGGAGSTGGAGKGGASNAGASSTGGAGKGGGGASAGGASAGGASAGGVSAGGASAGTSSGGSPTGSATCDAAHSVATLITSQVYTGKANDCVRLAVDPSWSVIGVKFQTDPETEVYPVPFSFFSCGGNGTGTLTKDYESVTLKAGANPGCDFFVQFEGGATKIKVTYYD